MEMCYNGTLVMPSNYAIVSNDEMEYLGGGFSVSKAAFKYTVTAVVVAGCIALGGWLSVAGLKTVLGSMALKNTLISCIVKGIGMLGIRCGNALANKFVSGLVGCISGDFMGNVFDKYIDGLDGAKNGKVKIF